MQFDTSKSDAVLGIYCLGMCLSLSIAMIVLSFFDGYEVFMASQIVAIIGAIFFGIGSVMIFLNSNKARNASVDDSSSNLTRLLFLGTLITLVIGFLLTQL